MTASLTSQLTKGLSWALVPGLLVSAGTDTERVGSAVARRASFLRPLVLRDVTQIPPFQPLPERLAGLPRDETLHAGVPEWLDHPLRDWLGTAFSRERQISGGEEYLARRVLMLLRWGKDNPRQSYVERLEYASGMDLLIAIDAVLQLHPGWDRSGDYFREFHDQIVVLSEILTDSASLYRIDLQARRLTRRVDTTVQAAADSTTAAAVPTVADHLRTAWVAAYGLQPDPDKAYDHAILAIEELVCPLVSPRNNKSTLGTVIRDLRSQLTQWELTIEDTSTGQPTSIGAVIEMLELLWRGQSRHGGSANSRRQTQAEAESSVHMAAALIQWITVGVLRRKL